MVGLTWMLSFFYAGHRFALLKKCVVFILREIILYAERLSTKDDIVLTSY